MFLINLVNIIYFITQIYQYSYYNIFIFFKYPIFCCLFFFLFLYLRASLPRYKLIDFQNLYWKFLLVYSTVNLIVILLF